jgi:transcriptional regulator with XRE-family HTH domain
MKTHIGEEIKKVMKLRKKSQTEIAEELGLSRQAVSNLLDNADMNTEYLMRISVFLHYDFFMLYSQSLPNTDKPPIALEQIPTIENELTLFIEKIRTILARK